MREILFRGKRKDNGEWVEGGYYHQIDKRFGIRTESDIIICFGIYSDIQINIEVIPETIGQYTGLKDKNDNKIFEGDILKLGTGKIRYVFYGITTFRHTNFETYAKEFDHKDLGYEIIGNIHDNPELLEESK